MHLNVGPHYIIAEVYGIFSCFYRMCHSRRPNNESGEGTKQLHKRADCIQSWDV